MKKLLFILSFVALTFSCGQPMKITANPDNTAATSGTLGTVKASDGVVREPVPVDSLPKKDTLR